VTPILIAVLIVIVTFGAGMRPFSYSSGFQTRRSRIPPAE
jgi:hypothetical protein